MMLVNFKAYRESMGLGGINIAKTCEKVSKDLGILIVVAPQLCDLALISKEVDIPTYAQHVDPIMPGSKTGWIPPEAAEMAGAKGVILNHSEHPMDEACIRFVVERSRELGLETCVCAKDVEASQAYAQIRPDYVAIEPPELIGGEVSVVNADPEIVRGAVRAVKKVDERIAVLCGAGIKEASDISKALSLGTKGVLIASEVVKAKALEERLRIMVGGFL